MGGERGLVLGVWCDGVCGESTIFGVGVIVVWLFCVRLCFLRGSCNKKLPRKTGGARKEAS